MFPGRNSGALLSVMTFEFGNLSNLKEIKTFQTFFELNENQLLLNIFTNVDDVSSEEETEIK